MAKKNRNCCYAVRKGRRPGLYSSWEACEDQIRGYSGARFKGFTSRQEAARWLGVNYRQDPDSDSDLDDNPSPPANTSARTTPHATRRVGNSLVLCAPTPGKTTTNRVPSAASSSAHHSRYSDVHGSPAGSAYYAVARGRQPGIYHSWDDCNAQVKGFSGARFKKFNTLTEAEEFCAVYGGGGHFSQFKSEAFDPDTKASFSQEWARLSQSQGWIPGTRHYLEQRASALRNELHTHFFAPQSRELSGVKEEGQDRAPVIKEEKREDGPVIKEEEEQQGGAGMESVDEFDHQRHEAEVELHGFQSMCQAVGKHPGDTVVACERILKQTLVNIVDLIDASRTGGEVKVWADFQAFMHYTLDASGDKKIPVREAKKDRLLKCFLRDFSQPRDQYVDRSRCVLAREGRYGGGIRCGTVETKKRMRSDEDEGVAEIKKRARSEEGDAGIDIKRIRSEGDDAGIETNRAISGEGDAGIEIQSDRTEKGDSNVEIKARAESEESDAVQIVEVKRVRKEENNDFKGHGPKDKKVLPRWTPANSIMRRYISSV